MTKCIYVASILILFSCSRHISIYEISTNSPNITDGRLFVFENDTVKITYSFWDENGVMAYSVYNKLSTPLYIDWKKSSMIRNGNKIDYWKDGVTSSGSFTGRLYSGTITPNSIYSIGSGQYSFESIKPERVTFLAPNSSITRVQNKLFNSIKTIVSKPYLKKKLNKYDGSSTKEVEYKNYDPTVTPLLFRNFLSISTTETFTNEKYIDNTFYVSTVYDITDNDFYSFIKYNPETKRQEVIWTISNAKWFYVK